MLLPPIFFASSGLLFTGTTGMALATVLTATHKYDVHALDTTIGKTGLSATASAALKAEATTAAAAGSAGGSGGAGAGAGCAANNSAQQTAPVVEVDVDLSAEPDGGRGGPPRINATLSVRRTAAFKTKAPACAGGQRTAPAARMRLTCIGKRTSLVVNGKTIKPGSAVLLPATSIVEVGNQKLRVELNQEEMDKCVRNADWNFLLDAQ